MTIRSHVEALEAAIGDPRAGLPDEVFRFVSRTVPLINVDLLIQDDRARTLLTWRHDEFYGPGWHLPGSIIRFKETAAQRVQACARAEIGAEVRCGDAPLLVNESIATQRTRGHHIGLLYRCALVTPPAPALAAGDPPLAGQWRWHDACPPDLVAEQIVYARFF
jgi:ADP-ribose pyrophosphatase YjhB (NUDIX family)